MRSCCGIDELSRDANTIADPSDAALQHVADAKFAADLFDIEGFAFVSKGGVSRDDEKRFGPRQPGNDVLDHPVCKVLLIRIAAHILERHYSNGGFVGER